ncbi:hypothetical protein B0H14DRAFT_3656159 [Mycena olivaceomarginata]|nr:hypothetical protein B0H14DRAFT_3656159 [Mycena olivaceomarginata]
MHFAPPPHELVTRTPALDDAHQSVDTLGILLRRGRFVLAESVLSNLFTAQHHTLCMCFAPPPHELVTRTPALDDAHQSVNTLGMLLRRGRFVLAICSLHSVTLCMRIAPPPHELVTRTPALDDAHQSVDTLGTLLRRGRFVLVICSLHSVTLCMRIAPSPHELVTRTPALDDAHQSVDTLGTLLRRGRFVLTGSVPSSRLILCMRFVHPPHELVTRTPALDDAHQSVDTLGMLLRRGRMSGSGVTYYNEELKMLLRLLKALPDTIPEGDLHNFRHYVLDPIKMKDIG